LTDIELAHQQRELSDQLFKMKFQLKIGTDREPEKIRELKEAIARVHTAAAPEGGRLAGGNGPAAGASNPVKNTVTAKKERPARKAATVRKSNMAETNSKLYLS